MPTGVALPRMSVPWTAQTFPAAVSAGGLDHVYLLTARDGSAAAFYARNGYDTCAVVGRYCEELCRAGLPASGRVRGAGDSRRGRRRRPPFPPRARA